MNCEFMHIKGTKRSGEPNVKDARETLDRIAHSKTMKEKSMKTGESSSRVEKSSVKQTGKESSFLEKGRGPHKPPAVETGNGCGGDSNQKLMDLLQQLITMQTQQLQLLQHPQLHQISPQMVCQAAQLPAIHQHRNLHL